jgi:hypothetical protein
MHTCSSGFVAAEVRIEHARGRAGIVARVILSISRLIL